ncbi:Gfo/Idh/MocA family oxidoreductase [Candidatus Kapabacteria bacterium]|nr:Gfo/Idh/MocA family oxidoreductase [Candidatus Kapabacteria bacterium]
MSNKLNVGVIGCGYWGNHILRNFNNSENWNLHSACDTDKNQLSKQKQLYPDTHFTQDADELFDNPNIDAIAIATPVFSHFELAKKTLESNKHAWVEKPLTANYQEALALNKIAKDNNLCLNVDHTYIYTPSVQMIKEVIDSGELGDPLYFDSVRINLGLFQHDINVVWDLAPHDISILDYCIGKKPTSVSASGASVIKYSKKELENIAYLNLNYNNDMIAHIHVNWLSPVKIRKIIIGGTKKMLVFDDMQNSEKIRIYDSGVNINSKEDIYNSLVQYRIGDMYSPKIDNKEALKEEVDSFYNAIINKSDTITSGQLGADVVNILESANKSMKNNSQLIQL